MFIKIFISPLFWPVWSTGWSSILETSYGPHLLQGGRGQEGWEKVYWAGLGSPTLGWEVPEGLRAEPEEGRVFGCNPIESTFKSSNFFQGEWFLYTGDQLWFWVNSSPHLRLEGSLEGSSVSQQKPARPFPRQGPTSDSYKYCMHKLGNRKSEIFSIGLAGATTTQLCPPQNSLH